MRIRKSPATVALVAALTATTPALVTCEGGEVGEVEEGGEDGGEEGGEEGGDY